MPDRERPVAYDLSPAARDLLEALARVDYPQAPGRIRDARGNGWPDNRKRAALLGVLVRAGVVRSIRARGQRNAERLYQITDAGRAALEVPDGQ